MPLLSLLLREDRVKERYLKVMKQSNNTRLDQLKVPEL